MSTAGSNPTEIYSDSLFFFDRDHYVSLAEKLKGKYASAKPFPSIIIDDFIVEPRVLDRVLEEFPRPERADWHRFDNRAEAKLASTAQTSMGPITRHLLGEFNGAVMCEFLENLTGIDGLIPDPWLLGGGLHQIKPGGFLKIHADFNRHGKLRLDRRVNLLLYLNKDWKEDYGGHLELWDRDMERCVVKALPVFNRCVIFSITSTAYHGHPDPLTCPAERTRRSLALYYYTQGRPEEEVRPPHSTLFQERAGESLKSTPVREAVKKLLPPVVVDVVRFVRDRLKRQ